MGLVKKRTLGHGGPILGDVDFEANATRFRPNARFDLPKPAAGFDTSPNFVDPPPVDNIGDKGVRGGNATGKEIKTQPNFFDKIYDGIVGSEADLLGSALDIIPLVGAGLTKNKADNFFDDARLNSEDADFRLGQVSDLARPNFAAPARAPQGSSLAERTASEKFGDVAQRGQEAAFEIENAKSRIAQRENILDRENAQTQFNVGRQDRVDQINSRFDFNQGTNFRNKQLQFETAALANVNTRRSENAQINQSNLVLSAADILKNNDGITSFEAALAEAKKQKKKKSN